MSYNSDEISISDGNPIELYKFSYNGIDYPYTSSQYTQQVDGVAYSPEFIQRGDSLRLGDSGGTVETCVIIVPRTNPIALLYQGAPPELSTVRVQVFRIHGKSVNEVIRILDGIVSQVRFNGSEAELTITIENVLSRYIPRGSLSYHCQNCIYDEKCGLNADNYGHKCTVSDWSGLTISSLNLGEKPSGYFTDGYIKMGQCVRAISLHENNTILIKYPINDLDREGSFYAYPGCSQLFRTCALKFANIDNFNGVPYVQPYNAYKHETSRGVYWVNDNIIIRDTKGSIYEPSL